MARKLSNKPHTLTRTRDDGSVYTVTAETERKCRTAVFHLITAFGTGNAREANKFADSFDVGVPATHERYTYLIERTAEQ